MEATRAIAATMKAVGQVTRGSVDVLKLFPALKTPRVSSAHDILVRVHATSMNPVDAKSRESSALSGTPRPLTEEEPLIVGYDAAGVVEETGSEARAFRVGDEVYFSGAINRNGAHAQYVLVDERIVARKPRSLDWTEASAIPLVALTAWEGLIEQLHLTPGVRPEQSILVIGGAGGVGSITVQLARRLLGLTVVATASRSETEVWVRKMGAHHVINHRKPLLEQLKGIGLEGVNYIFNTADVDSSIEQWGELLLPFGGVVSILPPTKAQPNFMQFFLKRLTLSFELMFTRPVTGIGMEAQREILEKIGHLYDEGTLMKINTETLDLWKDYKLAHQRIESGNSIGKIVLRV